MRAGQPDNARSGVKIYGHSGARFVIGKDESGVAIIKKTGVYRSDDGHAFLFTEGSVISDDVLAKYHYDESANGESAPADVPASGYLSADDPGAERAGIEAPESADPAPHGENNEPVKDGAPENRDGGKPANRSRK